MSQLGSTSPLVDVSVGKSPVGNSPVGVELGLGVPDGPVGRPLDVLDDGVLELLGGVLLVPVELAGGVVVGLVVLGVVSAP
jgi:hypothetical protein